MSRTDAHTPYWVTAEWWEPVHFRCRNSAYTWRQWRANGEHECDLPVEPVRLRPLGRRWRSSEKITCVWEPDYVGVSPWPRPPRWFVNAEWHAPERLRIRDTLRAAAADYRANGDTDVEPPPFQAKHGAAWLWT